MSHRLLFASAVLVLLTALCPAHAQQAKLKPPPAGVKHEANVVYGTGAGEPLKLDISYPEKIASAAPCLVVIHGGAWRGGAKEQLTDLTFQFAQRGFVAASVQYRLCPKHRFPAQVEDVKCAVRFLRSEAKRFQLDPQRVGAIGFSAGAHLAMLLGVMDPADGLHGEGGHAGESDKVQAVIGFFGPTDFSQTDLSAISEGLVNDFLGFTREENPEIRKRASPITYVDKADAPLLIFQGTRDPLVPHTQAIVMGEAMTKAGLGGRVELLIGAGHGWGGEEIVRSFEQSVLFFSQQLKFLPVKP